MRHESAYFIGTRSGGMAAKVSYRAATYSALSFKRKLARKGPFIRGV
jgi:hypothetical protein